jgi:predicted glutamine amidotransferase
MCLIAYAPSKSLISMESLANAYENNKDGWGICYQDPTTNQLVIQKSLLGFDNFKEAWAEVPDDAHVGVHFRWRTHGDLSVDNVHPYMILDKANGDPVDLALMHNGVISYIHKSGDPRSDTQMYVDLILRPILKDNWKLIYNESFSSLVERDISSGSKFLILPSEGAPVIFNEDSGHEDKEQPGVWYSNSYSIKTSTWRASKNAPVTSYTYPSYTKGASKGYTSNGTFWDADDQWGYNSTTKAVDTAIDEFVWPVDMTPAEQAEKDKIMALVPEKHKILERIERNGKMVLGYGWLLDDRYVTQTLVYDSTLGNKLRAFLTKRKKSQASAVVVPITPPPVAQDKELEKQLNITALKLSSRSETLNWLIENPDDAVKVLIMAKMSGGSKAIMEWINKDIDRAAEYIYHYSHFNTLPPDASAFEEDEACFDNQYLSKIFAH